MISGCSFSIMFSEGSVISGISTFVCTCNRSSLDPDCWCWHWSTRVCPPWSYYKGNWTICRNKFLWGYTLPSARTCHCKFQAFRDKENQHLFIFSLPILLKWTWDIQKKILLLALHENFPHFGVLEKNIWRYLYKKFGLFLTWIYPLTLMVSWAWNEFTLCLHMLSRKLTVLGFTDNSMPLFTVEDTTHLWPSVLASSYRSHPWRYACSLLLLVFAKHDVSINLISLW